MKTNVGGIDSAVRIGVGIALLAAVVFAEGQMRWWGSAGLVPLLTGLFGFCPLYTLLGLNTCPMEKKPG